MIKTIIKRDGSKEDFNPNKVNGWGIWAAEKLGRYVDWASIVTGAISTLPNSVTSKELQEALIKKCLEQRTWEYNLMAGRLYASLLVRLIHNSSEYPTIKEVQQRLVKDNLMRQLDYTDADYEQLEKVINHGYNLKYPHYAIHQNRNKYALKNRVKNIEYETTQFMYMRMAMALAEKEPLERRLSEVKAYYEEFANHRINVPTPYYVNLGTHLDGYASCCIFQANDEAPSLAAADHIAYMMTVMSAGIGYHLKTRSLGDSVRGGLIEHQGKLPYLRSYSTALAANLQNGRGGAGTAYYNAYDPEIETLLKLKNPITPQAKQIRGSDYSFGSNRLVVQKCARNEDIALFSYKDAPELYNAIYSGDNDYFERLYEKFLKSKLPRTIVSARKIVVMAMTEAFETGRTYEHMTDWMNTHTPFLNTIWSSNLCLTGDTILNVLIGDKHLEMTLKDVVESQSKIKVKSYNIVDCDVEYKEITAKAMTAKDAALMEIGVSTWNKIKCTPDHQIYTKNRGYVEAKHLSTDDIILHGIDGVFPDTIEHLDYVADVYDITVEGNHNFFANDILVHNCSEIDLPTSGFKSVKELYESYNESQNFIRIKSGRKESQIYSFDRVNTKRQANLHALKLQEDDVILNDDGTETVVEKVVERSAAGEIALCNIGGIIVSNIKNDDEYYNSCYRVLKMVRFGILSSSYVFQNLKETAEARMNAGIGIVGLAHLMAKKGLSYSSQDGINFCHELAETHYWHLVNASLELSKEYGVAKWMHKTKWVDGWTPLDTYCKNVDELVTVENKRDWKGLSEKIKANGGILNSVLASHMPSESSSISGATTNGLYPIRDFVLNKTNETQSVSYVVPDSTKLKHRYESAWEIPTDNLTKVYAVFQKWCDQGISADRYRKIQGDEKVGTKEMITGFNTRYKYGIKQGYYQNTKGGKDINLNSSESVGEAECESCSI